jgi:superfamily I DNA/RNA helicase
LSNSGFTPTSEQQAVVDLFRFGDSIAVEAGAGTGKTTTLRLLAEASDGRGQYVAFNRSIVNEASRTMPDNVACDTMHGLAYRALGKQYRSRLNSSARQRGDQVARFLGLQSLVISYGSQRKVIQPATLASLVQRTITVFCQTADDFPDAKRHTPYVDGIDPPRSDGGRGWANNDRVRAHIADAVLLAWADLQLLEGRMRFRHEHYLKMWQLGRPRLPVDFLMDDEAQDTSPVMLDVVARQDHAQLVFVGDSQQAIYEFTGAVNALAKVPASQRAFLTQSFRFGQTIADVANDVLAEIGAELRIKGHAPIDSMVGPIAEPACILTRTNATAVDLVLKAQQRGVHVHLLGKGKDVLAFAEAAGQLMAGQPTWHPELSCFTTWGEVQTYVEQDPQGSELALLVTLVDTYGVAVIIDALGRMCPEEAADLIVSTAHKAKGREWDTVQLADDFPDPRQSFEAMMNPEAALPELRLIYVAATRARYGLDVTRVPLLQPNDPTAAIR